jgi:two-component system, cell cycle sensor histidine kinase and response regulator CckA
MAEKPTYEELEQRVQELEKNESEYKSSKEALGDSEAHYRLLFEHVNIGIFIAQNGYLKVPNPYLSKLLGYSLADLDEKPFSLFIHPEYQSIVNTRHQERLKGKNGLPQTYDFRVITKHGTSLWVQLSTVLIQFKGRPATLNFLHDITERKSMEEALRKSEERLKLALDSVSDAVWDWRVDTGEVYFSTRWYTMLGYKPYELPQAFETWRKLLHPDDLPGSEAGVFQHLESAEPFVIEFRMRTKDNHWRWILARGKAVEQDNQGKAVRMLGIHMDITERKQAEMDLQSQRKLLEGVLDSIKDIIGVQLPDHTMVQYNRAGYELLGLTKDQVQGKKCYALLGRPHPCDNCAASRAYISKELETVEKYIPELGRHFLCTSNPILDNNKNIKLIIQQLTDITEKKKIDEQISQLQKAESLGRMAGAIAHHFNNQLSVVMGNLELVLDDLPDDAENRENLFQSLEAGHKAAEVSRQMLRYLGHISGSQTTIDLSDVCRQSLAFLQSVLPRGMTLNVDFPDSGPFVHADTGQIQQLLTNLFTNAKESLPDNQGNIDLVIQTVSHEDISTSNRFPLDWEPQDIPYACLEISDTGCGISKEDIGKIFDPFFTTKFTGRGMGLPVTMGNLKTHGGCIVVDSEPGCGSVFRVYLPVSAEKNVDHEKMTTPKRKVGNGGTVLLIEDEESVRNTAKIMISRLGYKVIEAQDGIEAVRLFQEHQNEIDCVLSDLTMPRMNGWETLTALREKGADVPVILASGYDENTVMAGDHPELPQAFLNKPYSMAALKDVLMEVIRL